MAERKTGPRQALFVVNNPHGLRVSKELATEIGLNESLLFLQIEYWISVTRHNIDWVDAEWYTRPPTGDAGKSRRPVVHQRVVKHQRWCYESISTIQEEAFPFWSQATIQRTILSLASPATEPTKRGPLILVGQKLNRHAYDRTRWFTLNYDAIRNLSSVRVADVKDEAAAYDASDTRTNPVTNPVRAMFGHASR